jgi:hypothetical protein
LNLYLFRFCLLFLNRWRLGWPTILDIIYFLILFYLNWGLQTVFDSTMIVLFSFCHSFMVLYCHDPRRRFFALEFWVIGFVNRIWSLRILLACYLRFNFLKRRLLKLNFLLLFFKLIVILLVCGDLIISTIYSIRLVIRWILFYFFEIPWWFIGCNNLIVSA